MPEENRLPVPAGEASTSGKIAEDDLNEVEDEKSTRKVNRCGIWCKKYFWEGPALKDNALEVSHRSEWLIKLTDVLSRNRRPVAIAIPAIFVYLVWLSIMSMHNLWYLFPLRYKMSITMVFGSIIAGMTSEGGGAIAFPVMTLLLGISPAIARDFSLMIQSVGMIAAAFTIFWMRIQLERTALFLCSAGGIVGITVGLSLIDPLLTPAQKKIAFVSIWFSFAFALFLLNRNIKRKTFRTMPQTRVWMLLVLFLSGVVGGLFSSIAGSGLDITCFSILTLLFRVTEKTATPTSVVLMAINTCVGAFWRLVILQKVDILAWEYLAVCAPIVVFGAPTGALLGAHFHRLVQAGFIYILDTLALVSALIIVPMTVPLWILAASLLVGGFLLFITVTFIGNKILLLYISNEQKETETQEKELKEASTKPAEENNNAPADVMQI